MKEDVFSKEDEESIKEAGREYDKQLEKQCIKDNKIMESIRNIVSKNTFKQIEEELKESSGGWDFEIVNKPLGSNQDYEDCEVWVNQTTNGGYSGDEFAGTCYFKIGENKYLRWNYAM